MAKVTFNDNQTEHGSTIITGANLNQVVTMCKAIAINDNPAVIDNGVLNFGGALNVGAGHAVNRMPDTTLTFPQPVNGPLTITNAGGGVINILSGNQLPSCIIKVSGGNFIITLKKSVSDIAPIHTSYFDFFNHHHDRDNDPDAGGCGMLVGEGAPQEIEVY